VGGILLRNIAFGKAQAQHSTHDLAEAAKSTKPGAAIMIDAGNVIECPPGSWKFTGSPHTLFLRVEKVRDDLSGFYDGEVWLEGQQLARDGTPLGRLQALVTVDLIRVLQP